MYYFIDEVFKMGMNELRLDYQISEMALKFIGFETTDTSNISGTAIDDIRVSSVVSPEIYSSPAIMESYNCAADLFYSMFDIIMLIWFITYLCNKIESNNYSTHASMTTFLKRGLIGMIGVKLGIMFLSVLIILNEFISIEFGYDYDLVTYMVDSLTSVNGAGMISLTCAAIAYLALYYLIRMIIIGSSAVLWVLVCFLWVISVGNSPLSQKAEELSIWLLLIILINIFMASVMSILFGVGTAVSYFAHDQNMILQWGTSAFGLVIVILAGCIPPIMLIWVVRNPVGSVKNTGIKVIKVFV